MPWDAIESWLREHHVEGVARLNPGASDEALAAFARELDVDLPPAFVRAWRAHDGEAHGDDYVFSRRRELLPLAAIASEWRTMSESLAGGGSGSGENACAAGPGVRPMYWNRRWIPFALLGGATEFHCLDLDPAEGGAVGQVIHVSDDLIERRVVAPNLDAYLAELARSLGARDTPAPPTRPQPAPPTDAVRPVELWRFALRVAVAALFWFAVYHAVTVRTAPWIAASVALWVVWFIVRRAHARAGA